MSRVHPLALAVLLAGSALPALAAETPADDIDLYKQKMSDCQTQMTSAHPEMSAKQRKKACKAQLGPAPHGVVPAKAPAPVL